MTLLELNYYIKLGAKTSRDIIRIKKELNNVLY